MVQPGAPFDGHPLTRSKDPAIMNSPLQPLEPRPLEPGSGDPVVGPSRPRLLGVLDPGLVTGASDDDPNGIATYSQIGAAYGYALSWTLLFSYPLMVAIQLISARIAERPATALRVC
jgi:hypothetical protein